MTENQTMDVVPVCNGLSWLVEDIGGKLEEFIWMRARVQKLKELASRNKKEKVVYDAAVMKLNQTRKTLAEVEGVHASASNVAASKEEKKNGSSFDENNHLKQKNIKNVVVMVVGNVDKLFHDGTAVSAIIGGPSSVVVLCVRNCSAE
ncbi:hypothetical protein E3N88_09093 [Mikania micrantha]|uniref:Uncharacterized protein n=1 Tax=Mikania micrantha TaxID=192012 RepID=A0A5N6PJ12_9ASTR|nr:hypothetical protein E3N88_09093 [Mikania micrantha]